MYNDLTDITILYSLDILDEGACRWVEDAIAITPTLAVDLIEFRVAATAFAYDLSPVSPSPVLKTRLFERIATEDRNLQDILPNESASPQTRIHTETIPWEPDIVPGVTTRLLYQDVVMREMTRLVRCEAGVHYPAHRHGGVEEIFILEGDLVIEDRVYRKGGYIRSETGSVHAISTQTGCLFFARHSMDNEFVTV